MKLTEWYPGTLKPLPDRVGPYLRKNPTGFEHYCWWDGGAFGCSAESPGEAHKAFLDFGRSLRQDFS